MKFNRSEKKGDKIMAYVIAVFMVGAIIYLFTHLFILK